VSVQQASQLVILLEDIKEEVSDADFGLGLTDPRKLRQVLVADSSESWLSQVSGDLKQRLDDALGQLCAAELQHQLEEKFAVQQSKAAEICSVIFRNIAACEEFDSDDILIEPEQAWSCLRLSYSKIFWKIVLELQEQGLMDELVNSAAQVLTNCLSMENILGAERVKEILPMLIVNDDLGDVFEFIVLLIEDPKGSEDLWFDRTVLGSKRHGLTDQADQENDPVDKLRGELEAQSVKGLRARAKAVGATAEQLEHAADSEDHRTVLLELLLQLELRTLAKVLIASVSKVKYTLRQRLIDVLVKLVVAELEHQLEEKLKVPHSEAAEICHLVVDYFTGHAEFDW
jgi:hypothetical protein